MEFIYILLFTPFLFYGYFILIPYLLNLNKNNTKNTKIYLFISNYLLHI